jgi:multimeric flavodoxin WrbA
MSIVILNGIEDQNIISDTLVDMIKERGGASVSFNLGNMEILPCRSCGACSIKSPGRCVVRDDAHEILKAIARADTFIMLTPIRFGGYSSCLKKMVDKFMLLGLPLYTVKHGHLLHPNRYGSKHIIGIGVYDGKERHREKSFKRLVKNNALNLQCTHEAFVLKPSEDNQELKRQIIDIIREVC